MIILNYIVFASRLPTPDELVKHMIIGAQGLGSDPQAGRIRHSVATAVCHHFEGSWESKVYCTIANEVTVAEMSPATRYTHLRITASIIKI